MDEDILDKDTNIGKQQFLENVETNYKAAANHNTKHLWHRYRKLIVDIALWMVDGHITYWM